MRSTNTFGVQFIIRKNKLRDGLAPIHARITVNGHRVEVSMKRRIHPTVPGISDQIVPGISDQIVPGISVD